MPRVVDVRSALNGSRRVLVSRGAGAGRLRTCDAASALTVDGYIARGSASRESNEHFSIRLRSLEIGGGRQDERLSHRLHLERNLSSRSNRCASRSFNVRRRRGSRRGGSRAAAGRALAGVGVEASAFDLREAGPAPARSGRCLFEEERPPVYDRRALYFDQLGNVEASVAVWEYSMVEYDLVLLC